MRAGAALRIPGRAADTCLTGIVEEVWPSVTRRCPDRPGRGRYDGLKMRRTAPRLRNCVATRSSRLAVGRPIPDGDGRVVAI
jgi:hypothetical protein